MTRHCVGEASAWTTRVVSVLAIALGLCAAGVIAQGETLTINDRQYFEKRGLNVLVFTNEHNGMFFDEKTAGIELIHHGVRTATGGAVRLSPTPEQWDQIPKLADRKVDPKTNTIEVTLRYEAFDFDSRLVVMPDGAGFKVVVYVDKPVPADLEGRAGLDLEFVPSRYWERTYLVDGKPGIFPRSPAGPTTSLPPEKKIRQFEAAFAGKVHLLWLGVGTQEPERMRTGIQGLHASLREAGIEHVYYESPGTDHEWQTWRRDLKDFAPRLFR